MIYYLLVTVVVANQIDPNKSYVEWTGLKNIHQPIYYFHIYVRDATDKPLLNADFLIQIEENGRKEKQTQKLNRHDGSYIYRFRPRRRMNKVTFHVTDLNGNSFRNSGKTMQIINHSSCKCPIDLKSFLVNAGPTMNFDQIDRDFGHFKQIKIQHNNQVVKDRFCKHPGAVSICKYRIHKNEVYRSCFGDHVGFNMFSDDILLQLARMVELPEVEFWMNLGDWPQQKMNTNDPAAVISWCGHNEYTDIVVPTYDVAESTMHMMHKISQDQFSLQQSAREINWSDKKDSAFFRGRDSNENRIKLAKMKNDHIDAGITNFFFFEKDEKIQKKYVPFDRHFEHKYQINIDGTVAAYRLPYLLLGNSLVIKQKSSYYEHFYSLLNLNEPHYLEVANDLSDLEEKLEWIRQNDDIALEMIQNANKLMDKVLDPINVYSYWLNVLNVSGHFFC